MTNITFITDSLSSFRLQDFKIFRDLSFNIEAVEAESFTKLFMKGVFKGFKADLFYAWFATSPGFTAVVLGKIYHKPSIVVAGGFDVCKQEDIGYGLQLSNPKRVKYVKYTLRNASRVIAVSNHVASMVSKLEPNSRVEVIYNGVDTSKFTPSQISEKENMLVSVGVISKENLLKKGFITIVKAMPIVMRYCKDVKLMIVGGKRDGYPILLKEIRRLNIENNVVFPGFVNEDTLISILRKAIIYVHPAGHESFGISIAEAMSCGLPVITTKRGAIPEVVGDAGMYVPFNNPQLLAESILTLLNDEKLRNKLSHKARERAVQMFDIKIRALKLKSLVEELVH